MHPTPTTTHLSTKLDLLLIHQLSRPSQLSQIQPPQNLQQLYHLLKFKNSLTPFSRHQRQKAQAWLSAKGADITPLKERIRQEKQLLAHKQQLQLIEQDCIFYIPDMTYPKIQEYLHKAAQYQFLVSTQKSMIKSNKNTRNLYRIAKQRNQSALQFKYPKTSQEEPQPKMYFSINTQPRSQQKRQDYINCVTLWVKNHARLDSELATILSQKINTKIWNIMSNHIKSINQNQDISEEKAIAQLYMESLRMIEDKYREGMPKSTAEQLQHYVQTVFFSKLQKSQLQQIKYINIKQGEGAFWAKAFALYRAGMKADFYNLLARRNEIQVFKSFREVDLSIQNRQPITKSLSVKIEDVFYEQLVFALQGQGKYSSRVVGNTDTMDPVWIILRNLGIFYDRKKDEVEKFKKELLQFYRKHCPVLNRDQLYNHFYLLAYDEIAAMETSEIMDQDDFVHFLICLCGNPKLIKSDVESLRSLLKSRLLLYITELINLGKPQYIYYMVCIPKEYRVSEIKKIISSSSYSLDFDWQLLKPNLDRNQFQQIVSQTIGKDARNAKEFIEAAEKLNELLGNGEQSVRCLLQFLLKNFLNTRLDAEGVSNAQVACDRYIYLNSGLNPNYKNVLNFAIEFRKLRGLEKDNDEKKIYKLVNESRYLILGAVVYEQNLNMLKLIEELTGTHLDVYFRYLKSVINGLESYFKHCGDDRRYDEFMEFVMKVEQNTKTVLDRFPKAVMRQETHEIMAVFSRVLLK